MSLVTGCNVLLFQDYKTYLDFVLAMENRKEPQVCFCTSLVPRPPLFLPSVCIHKNTRERKTGKQSIFFWSSTPVYCKCKQKVKTGEAWEQDYFYLLCMCWWFVCDLQALQYLLRLVDIRGQGYLDAFTLNYFFRVRVVCLHPITDVLFNAVCLLCCMNRPFKNRWRCTVMSQWNLRI